MATFFLCPFASFLQVLNDSGGVVTNALIWTYAAGTSTPTNTWTDNTGVTPNSNPIQLNSAGRLNNVSIWQQGGVPIKVIFTTNAGTPSVPVAGPQIGPTFDQVYGINDFTSGAASLLNPASGSGADLVANAVRSYDIFASMRSANTPSLAGGQTLIVIAEGASAANDGGGGVFYWNASSSSTDDNANVIKPTAVSGNGRYLRLFATRSGSFTGTLTGMSGATTGTVKYEIDGKTVRVWVDANLTGTSNSIAMTMTGLPAAITPANQRNVTGINVINAGAAYMAEAVISNGGVITFNLVEAFAGSPSLVGSNTNVFNNTGTKGLNAGWLITYGL